MKHKWDSRLQGEYADDRYASDTQMTPPVWQKGKNYRASWWKWKKRVEKPGLKLIIQKNPISSWQIGGETMEMVTNFIFLGSKIIVDGDCSQEEKWQM